MLSFKTVHFDMTLKKEQDEKGKAKASVEDLNRVIILDSCARPAISRKLIREREKKAKQRKKTRHLNGLLMVVGDALVSCFFGVKQINAQKTCKELLQTSKADKNVSHFSINIHYFFFFFFCCNNN